MTRKCWSLVIFSFDCTTLHVGSQFLYQGSNLYPLQLELWSLNHWKSLSSFSFLLVVRNCLSKNVFICFTFGTLSVAFMIQNTFSLSTLTAILLSLLRCLRSLMQSDFFPFHVEMFFFSLKKFYIFGVLKIPFCYLVLELGISFVFMVFSGLFTVATFLKMFGYYFTFKND